MGRKRLVTIVLAVAVVGVLDADAVLRVDNGRDESFVPQARGDEPDTQPPAGLQHESLIRRENLAPALRRLQGRSGGGRVRLLRVAPDRVEVQVMTGEQRLRTLQHRYTGETETLSDTSAPTTDRATFAWSAVDPSAPRRLAEHAVRGRSARELRSLVLADDGAGPRWTAFLSSGVGFSAGADGRDARPTGG